MSRIGSSSSTRCVDTVRPYAEHSGWPIEAPTGSRRRTPPPPAWSRSSTSWSTSGEDALLCTHRPVLPSVYDALGIAPEHHATGEMVVIHHRHGRVRAVERHLG